MQNAKSRDGTTSRSKNVLHPQKIEEVRQQIQQLLHDNPDLIADHQARLDMIEGETEAVALLRSLEMLRQATIRNERALQQHIERLERRRARYEVQESNVRWIMMKLMEEGDLRNVPLPEATLSLRTSPPKVVITDETIVPDTYKNTLTTINKLAIRAVLLAKGEVPGATLSNQPDTLSIRTD